MKSAMIALSLLGCDDQARHCHYLETIEKRFETRAACQAASEDILGRVSGRDYPVLVTVCENREQPVSTEPTPESARDEGITDATITIEAGRVLDPPRPSADIPVAIAPETDRELDGEPAMVNSIVQAIQDSIPDGKNLREWAGKPVQGVSRGYSWIVRKLDE